MRLVSWSGRSSLSVSVIALQHWCTGNCGGRSLLCSVVQTWMKWYVWTVVFCFHFYTLQSLVRRKALSVTERKIFAFSQHSRHWNAMYAMSAVIGGMPFCVCSTRVCIERVANAKCIQKRHSLVGHDGRQRIRGSIMCVSVVFSGKCVCVSVCVCVYVISKRNYLCLDAAELCEISRNKEI